MDYLNVIHSFSDSELKNDQRFLNIAKWFIRFLESEEDNMTLVIPFFDQEFAIKAYNSFVDIAWFFNLLRNNNKKYSYADYNLLRIDCNRELFDNKNIDDWFLKYKGSKGDFLIWDQDVLTKTNVFLPLFKIEEIESVIDLNPLINSFPYFKKIRTERILNKPLPLNLDNGKILFYDCGEISNFEELNNISTRLPFLRKLVKENLLSKWRLKTILRKKGHKIDSSSIRKFRRKIKINEIEIEDAHKLEDEEAERKEDLLLDENIYLQIRLKYPYSKNPHHYLYTPGKKKFLIQFRHRYLNKNLNANEVNLLPREVNYHAKSKIVTPRINIVETEHSQKLYELLATLKDKWRNLGLNKFVVPYPKYWFQFIHQGESLDFWIEDFRRSYPVLIDRPIFTDIRQIIEELYILDWIYRHIHSTETRLFLFPKPSGLRSKRLQTIIHSFKNYIETFDKKLLLYQNTNFLFEENVDQVELLCGFNIPDVINITQNPDFDNVLVTIPDFLYYNYQPWISYHLFIYQAEVLVNDIRQSIDPLIKENRGHINERKNEIIKKIKNDFHSYLEKYDTQGVSTIEEESTIDLEEDIELTNDEELDLNFEINHQRITIKTIKGKEYSLDASNKILVKRDSILKLPSSHLKLGDLILTDDDILSYLDNERFFRKLTSIPHSSKYYQKKLNTLPKAFDILKNRGLSISSQNYFQDKYQKSYSQITDDSFLIPRSKQDWELICEYLNIDEDTMNATFSIAKTHGRRLNKIYSKVIKLMIDTDSFGLIGDPELLAQTTNVLNEDNEYNVDEKSDEHHLKDLGMAILSSISSNLEFHEIIEIHYE